MRTASKKTKWKDQRDERGRGRIASCQTVRQKHTKLKRRKLGRSCLRLTLTRPDTGVSVVDLEVSAYADIA